MANQIGNKIIYIAKNFIWFTKLDSSGNTIDCFFSFDNESKVRWYDVYYDRPWY